MMIRYGGFYWGIPFEFGAIPARIRFSALAFLKL